MSHELRHHIVVDPESELQLYIHTKIQALHEMYGKRNNERVRKLSLDIVLNIKKCLINLYTPQNKAFSELNIKKNLDTQFFRNPSAFPLLLQRLYNLQLLEKMSKDKFKLTRKARKIAKTYHKKRAKLQKDAEKKEKKEGEEPTPSPKPNLTANMSARSLELLDELKEILIKILEKEPVKRKDFLAFAKTEYLNFSESHLGAIVSTIFYQLVQTGMYTTFIRYQNKYIKKKEQEIVITSLKRGGSSVTGTPSIEVLLSIKKHFLEELDTGKEISRKDLGKWAIKEHRKSGFYDGTLHFFVTQMTNEVLNEDKSISKIKRGNKIFYQRK